MDLALTTGQLEFKRRLRGWLGDNLAKDWGGPRFVGPDDEAENAALQTEWERKLYAAGFQGVHWPTEYGGQGMTIVEQFIVAEELGRASAPEGINTIGKELVGPILLALGTEEQKRHLIPRILNLDDIWCQGFSEPGAGSDLAGLSTRAVRDGDDWIVNGQKLWTSFARFANKCILLARTDPAAPKHKGLTLFVMDMATPGITVRPVRQITGRHEFNEVFLNDVRIPAGSHLGEVNEGWHASIGVLGYERATARLYRQARFLAEFRALIEKLQAGDRLDPAHWTGQQAASLLGELRVLRLLNLKTVSSISNGRPIGSEASMIKLFWSELHQRVMDFATDAFGDAMVTGDPDVERFRHLYLQSRAETIYAGTSEIQRNIIAERMLGLPRQA